MTSLGRALLCACALAATQFRLRARNKLGLFMRGAYGGAAVLFYFIGIAHLPVGIATLLNVFSTRLARVADLVEALSKSEG